MLVAIALEVGIGGGSLGSRDLNRWVQGLGRGGGVAMTGGSGSEWLQLRSRRMNSRQSIFVIDFTILFWVMLRDHIC